MNLGKAIGNVKPVKEAASQEDRLTAATCLWGTNQPYFSEKYPSKIGLLLI